MILINRKLVIATIIAMIISIIAVFTGCTSTQANQTNDDFNQTNDDFLNEGGFPNEEMQESQIIDTYKRAVEAYGWFYLTTMPTVCNSDEDIREYEGWQYYRVEHETIKTLADLENYLRSLFSDNIVTKLLSEGEGKRYRDFDGILYAMPADRGTDINKGEETYEVIKESERKFILRVTVELLGEWQGDKRPVIGYETHDFIYEKINDRWVFSSFDLVR